MVQRVMDGLYCAPTQTADRALNLTIFRQTVANLSDSPALLFGTASRSFVSTASNNDAPFAGRRNSASTTAAIAMFSISAHTKRPVSVMDGKKKPSEETIMIENSGLDRGWGTWIRTRTDEVKRH